MTKKIHNLCDFEQEAVEAYIKVLKDLRTQAIVQKCKALEARLDEMLLDTYEIREMIND